MHRFFLSPQQIQGDQVLFRDDQAHQLSQVLRLGPGDCVLVLDDSGLEYVVALDRIDRRRAIGRIEAQRPSSGEPGTHLTLFQSLLQRDKFEWVLQKCTEVGVARFIPVITRRSRVRNATAVTPDRLARWQRIIAEAAEQSGRGRLPSLEPPISLENALEGLASFDRVLMPWEAAGPAETICGELATPAATVALFIGPEGGFDAEEAALAQSRGAVPVTLGRRILRAETAAVVASALVLHELGDME